jgi:recombination protein RecA
MANVTDKGDRDRAIELAIGSIEKAYGKGAIMRLREGDTPAAVPVIPTGSLSLDIGLGIGGYPRGRIVEIYGPESSGKTTLTLHAIAEAQKAGGVAAFIDAEHALDVTYARKLGVNTEELLVAQPDHGEQALEIADTLVRSGAVDMIVVDSVAALVPKAEIEGEMGDSHVGPAGPAHEPGPPQAHRHGPQVEHDPVLHQPDPDEDRRHVRVSRRRRRAATR